MKGQDEDYDLLPHKELFELKRQVEEIRGGPSSRKLMESMDDLKHTINELIGLFKATSQELKIEEKDEASIHKKLDRISGQQKVIAEALLSLSEKTTDEQQPAGPKEPMPELQQAPPQFPPQQPFQQQQAPMAPEPFTPQPFSLQSAQQQQPYPMQSPPPWQYPQQQGVNADFGVAPFNSPYGSAPSPGAGQSTQIPPTEEDAAGLDDFLGTAKKKKGILGMFKK